MASVIVITNPENGWDCVVGVYVTIDAALTELNKWEDVGTPDRGKEYYENTCGYIFHDAELRS